MKVVVNDANILIDLVDLGLLPLFFLLKFEFHTTELIINELFEDQQLALSPYIKSGKLYVEEICEEDLAEIFAMKNNKPMLSEQDCSAFHKAQKHGAVLITSDNTLRKFAINQNIEVHGHLWVFDHLVRNGIMSGTEAAKKLHELCQIINPKLGLPVSECQQRFKEWSKIK